MTDPRSAPEAQPATAAPTATGSRLAPVIDARTWAIAVGVGVAATLLARATLLPDVGRWDTGEAQTVPALLGTMHPTGFPAYALLGWLVSTVMAPFAAPALAMNLLSAACLGVAAAGSAIVATLLTDRRALGVATGLGVAATPVVWGLGVRADVHALHIALVAALLVALVGWARATTDRSDRWLLAAAVLFGLALANHRLTLFLAPGIALYVLLIEPGVFRRPRLLGAALALSLGLAAVLYLELPLRAGPFRAELVYGHPDTLIGFLEVVTGSQFGGSVGEAVRDPGAAVGALARVLGGQFGPFALLVPIAAAVTIARRPQYAVLTIPAAILTGAFALIYDNAFIERYWAVPLLMAWTWLAVAADAVLAALMGVGRAGGTSARRRGIDPRLAALASVAAAVVLLVPTIAELPARWRAVDASKETIGRAWLESALAALPQGAVVVSWWSYSTPLWYAQHIERRRTDLTVIDDRTRLDQQLGDVPAVIDANLGVRPVYLLRVDNSEIQDLFRRYRLTVVPLPAGQSLLRVDSRREGA